MIIYIHNFKDSTEKLELISEISMYTHKTGIQKLIAFLEIDMQKAMAPHSSTLAWKIPWTEEPGGLRRVGHGVHGVAKSWTRLSDFTFTHWRRKWQPAPVFLPGESQGQGSLVGCCLWGRTESDTTEAT